MNRPNTHGNIPSVVKIACLVILGIFACRDNPPVVYPTAAPFSEADMPLGPEDKIQLTVYYGSRELKAAYTIDASGTIEVQYIGSVSASGKTKREVENDIRSRLGDGFLKDPIVSISIIEINSQKLSVQGQVARSGPIKFRRGMTITEAIATSGGFMPMARKNMVKVTRQLEGKKEIYKLPVEMMNEGTRPNFEVMPGDEVFVPERPW